MAKTFEHSYNVCPDCAKGIHEHPGHDCKNLIPEGQCMCYHGAEIEEITRTPLKSPMNITIIEAIDIWKAVNAVKTNNNGLLREGKKKYVSVEDIRAVIFDFDHRLKHRAEEGKGLVGWQDVDVQYVRRIIDETMHETYQKLKGK